MESMGFQDLGRALVVVGLLMIPAAFVIPTQTAIWATWVGLACLAGGALSLALGHAGGVAAPPRTERWSDRERRRGVH